MVGIFVQSRQNFAGGMERLAGVAERVAQFGRVGASGKQVLGNTASKKTVIIMLFFPSLARGPGVLTRRNEHTSAVETRGRGMETAKFVQNEGGAFFI